jgi:hypothetical protein
MYVVTVETLQPGQARHTHLCSYRLDLKNVRVYVYYISIVVTVFSVETRIIFIYLYINIIYLYCGAWGSVMVKALRY